MEKGSFVIQSLMVNSTVDVLQLINRSAPADNTKKTIIAVPETIAKIVIDAATNITKWIYDREKGKRDV